MKLKELVEALQNANPYGMNGLYGKDLNVLIPYFEIIDEFKGKSIEIIEDFAIISQSIQSSSNGYKFDTKTDPELVTIKGTIALTENVKLNAIFIYNGELFLRCTKDSTILE